MSTVDRLSDSFSNMTIEYSAEKYQEARATSLTSDTTFSEKDGEETTLVWVKTLDASYGSKTSKKLVQVPFDPDAKMEKMFACLYFSFAKLWRNCFDKGASKEGKNFLLSKVHYVMRLGSSDTNERVVLDGGYLYFGKQSERTQKRATVFVSGSDDLSHQPVDKCHALMQSVLDEFPQIELLNKNHLSELDCNGVANNSHSEDWMIKCLDRHPEIIMNRLVDVLMQQTDNPSSKAQVKPKLYDVVLDFRSIKNVCDVPNSDRIPPGCRQLLHEVANRLSAAVKRQGALLLQFPRGGPRITFRCKSHQPYGFDRPWKVNSASFLDRARGGFDPTNEGIDLKEVGGITLASRSFYMDYRDNRRLIKEFNYFAKQLSDPVDDEFEMFLTKFGEPVSERIRFLGRRCLKNKQRDLYIQLLLISAQIFGNPRAYLSLACIDKANRDEFFNKAIETVKNCSNELIQTRCKKYVKNYLKSEENTSYTRFIKEECAEGNPFEKSTE